ncbi:AAA family ATPase [Gynurincola endophyticus]|jgi:MoxR-like ATPase|uniref:AAA family ATPase n=1 Tax=Gynurincola endophyticus TaxID=2479004 RepID=UPI0018F60E0D|nr:MoxR family ATPase [Gynurincola endophyticus]
MTMSSTEIQQLSEQIKGHSSFLQKLKSETSRVIIGQEYMIDRLLIGLLSNGHILLEGVPGLAKTLAIKSLANTLGGKFSRIQFTPDLLPADLVGTMIYNQPKNEFVVRKGPVFANFVLADEINRAPAKVQSALLEAMQERQVTIGENTYTLEQPFLVLATQNPLEQEGTYPLPEAQQDRFLMKVVVDYPLRSEEKMIIRQNVSAAAFPQTHQVVQLEDILKARDLVKKIYIDEKIEDYILDIIFATRTPAKFNLTEIAPYISYGGSPRASISLALAAKAVAYLEGRAFVTPEDVQSIALDVLRHRIGLTYEAEAENQSIELIIEKIIRTIPVP